MLKDLLNTYYFDQNYNCAESVLRAANEYYDLKIEDRDMILMAGFGAGMQVGNTCGAVLGAIGALSMMYVEAKAHESILIKPKVTLFLERFQERLAQAIAREQNGAEEAQKGEAEGFPAGSVLCRDIRPACFRPEGRCILTVEAACDALEDAVSEPILSVEAMRESDAWTIRNKVPSKELMRRAGQAIFDSVEWKPPVAIVCGKGNNAGDGYVAAALMKAAGIGCRVILTSDQFSEDGKYYYDECCRLGIPEEMYREDTDLSGYGTILDCLLGTGFQGEVRGVLKEVIRKINKSGAYVVSADINSGLNGDTGEGNTYVKSDLTVSIGFYKYGHFVGQAGDAMKQKRNCDIGIVRITGDETD